MDAPDAETLQALHAIDWEATVPRLVLYAQHKMERLTWLGVHGEAPVRGIQPTDIVQQAVYDVLCGKRRWNKKKTFMHFLTRDVISSLVSNFVTSTENKRTVRYSSIALSKINKGRHFLVQTDEFEHIWSKHWTLSAHLALHDIQHRMAFEERRQLLSILSDDPLVYQIAMLIIDEDINTPKELSQRLHTDVKAIYLAKRRLRNRLIALTLSRVQMEFR